MRNITPTRNFSTAFRCLLLGLTLAALPLALARPGFAQASYYQNFEGTAVGSLPAGWTNINTPVTSTGQVAATSTISAPNGLSLTSTTDGQTVLYTGGTAVADEAAQTSFVLDGNNNPGLIVRSDAAGANYYLAFYQNTGATCAVYRRVGGAFTSIGVVSTSWGGFVGQKVGFKLQVQGSTLSEKMWLLSGAEPASYQYTQTDANVTAPGFAGFRFAYGSAGGNVPVADNFFVGAAGNGAFTPPATVMTVSPTTLSSGTTGNTVTLTNSNIVAGTTFSVASTGTGAAITAGSPATASGTATLTVTAGTAGTLTYSDSADALTASQTVTQSTTTIPITDANLFASPYTWNGGITVDAGAYRYFGLTLTAAGNVALNLNTSTFSSIAAGARPALMWTIDGGPRQDAQLTDANLTGTAPGQSLTLATGLAAGSHVITLRYKADDPFLDEWATPVGVVSIASLTAPGGTTTAPVTVKPKRMLSLGDSISAGEGVLGLNGAGGLWAVSGDATVAWPALVAGALNAEYGQVGIGGLGWAAASAGGTPAFPSSWNFLYSGVLRSFSTPPDYAFVNMGTNGNTTGTLATSGSTGTARAHMAALRAATGAGSLNVYIVPFGQQARAGLLNDLSYLGGGTTATNGYSTVTVGTSTVYKSLADPKTWVLDLGTAASAGLTGGGAATLTSFDGLHPTQATGAQLAALIVQAVQGGQASTATLGFSGQVRRGR